MCPCQWYSMKDNSMTTLTVWGGQRVNWVCVLFFQFTEVDYYNPGWFIFKDSTASLTTMEIWRKIPAVSNLFVTSNVQCMFFFFSTVVYFLFYFLHIFWSASFTSVKMLSEKLCSIYRCNFVQYGANNNDNSEIKAI